MSVQLMNASGCLDALTAPEVAASLDAFVTKTITPEPREGNPPVRIAETEAGMLNSIGLQGPGLEGLLSSTLPRLAALGLRVWVSVGGFSARGFRRDLRATRGSAGGRGAGAEPLVPERRGGAGVVGPDRRRVPVADDQAALREVVPGDVGYRRVGPRGRRRRGGRPVARQHPARDGARPGHAPADPRARVRRILGPRPETGRPRVRLCVRPRGRRADRRDGRRALRSGCARARGGGRHGCLPWHHPVRGSRRAGADSGRAGGRSRRPWVRRSARRLWNRQ